MYGGYVEEKPCYERRSVTLRGLGFHLLLRRSCGSQSEKSTWLQISLPVLT